MGIRVNSAAFVLTVLLVELRLILLGVVVVIADGDGGLSRSTVIGIIVGIVIMLLLLLLAVVMATIAVRRQRRKRHPAQSSSAASAARCTSSRSTTSVSTISAGNGSVLPSSFSGMSLHHPTQSSRPITNNNAGYLHRDAADEPPPPYSSLSTNSPPEQTSQPSAPVTGISRDRRPGRSLPPTPTRPPPPPTSQPRDAMSEHIYDEPSVLFADVLLPQPDTRPSATLATNPRSSMSRIRLGTTALRPGTLRCHSPLSASRQRPRGFGTHQPRRSTYLGPQISEPCHAVASGAASQPFFISNFSPSPNDMVHTDGSSRIMRDVNPSGRMLAYATGTPSMSPQQPRMSLDHRAGVYDQPWDSSGVVERVSHAAAIPLTAMPPRSVSTLNSSRRHASPHTGWSRSGGITHQEPRFSDWPGSPGHAEVFPADPVNIWPQQQYIDNYGPGYGGQGHRHTDFTDPDSAVFARSSNHPRNYYHPRADSSDSCGNSSSSPLVTDAPSFCRRGRDNSEVLDLMSPTCV